jgi:hypothetical protein
MQMIRACAQCFGAPPQRVLHPREYRLGWKPSSYSPTRFSSSLHGARGIMIIGNLRIRILFSCCLVLIGLAARCCEQAVFGAVIPSYLQSITQTASPYIGVTYYQIVQSLNDPLPNPFTRELAIHIVEIDPQAPGISFLGTPGNGAETNEYTRMTTGTFVNNNDLAIGINGDFYDTSTGITTNVNGLGMSNGEVISSPGTGGSRNSLVTDQLNVARIVTRSTIRPGTWNAVSGNQRMLDAGVIVTPNDSYTTTLNPHTAVGVDAANGHLFFMVVDGRQTDFSEGMRTDEMAQLFLDFGVDDAINLDGGGSSTLVFADGPGGSARAVNSPSDNATTYTAGTQRSVGNHFGVYATPNPAYVRLASPPRPATPGTEPFIPALTILDGFEGGEGRFNSAPNASGSTNGITAASTAVYTTEEAHLGEGSQKITLVRDTTASSRVRHLSGGASPTNNRVNVGGTLSAMGPFGFIGFFMKTTQADLSVYMGLDDGTVTTVSLERSTATPVIADGQWHLYEWNLADENVWSNFSSGNGTIGGPNAYLDSIFIESPSSTLGDTFSVYLDTVAYNPHGSLAILNVPEPTVLAMVSLFLLSTCPLSRQRR